MIAGVILVLAVISADGRVEKSMTQVMPSAQACASAQFEYLRGVPPGPGYDPLKVGRTYDPPLERRSALCVNVLTPGRSA